MSSHPKIGPHPFAEALRLYNARDLSGAQSILESLTRRGPADQNALHLLGLVHLARQDNDAALQALAAAQKLPPPSAAILCNYGRALALKGRCKDAINTFSNAVKLSETMPEAHFHLGTALLQDGQLDSAKASLSRALQLNPKIAQAHYNLGNVHRLQGNTWEAEASYREAIRLNPAYADAYSNLGVLLMEKRGHAATIVEIFRKAFELRPQDPDAIYDLANVLAIENKLNETESICADAAQKGIAGARLASLTAHTMQRMCSWRGIDTAAAALVTAARQPDFDGSAFPLLSLVDDAAVHLAASTHYAQNLMTGTPAAVKQPAASAAEKIKLAYCSADFSSHVMMYLLTGLFEFHDRNRFEVYGISFGPNIKSEARTRAAGAFDRFMEVETYTDEAIAAVIRDLGTDIAVDLKGYTRNHRANIFSYRPAPIQVNYLGYPGTMGTAHMDYILVDRHVVPSTEKHLFTEKLVHLPHCYWINDIKAMRASDRTPSRAEYKLPEDAFVFCCFSASYKISPDVFDIWMDLLHAVPNSVLWLLGDNPWMQKNLQAQAESRGIHAGRLVFAGRTTLPDHLARHTLADIGLDTFPYNGHTTVSDALYMNLPVVSYAGKTFASRVAGSMLKSVGLPELVAESLEDYKALVLHLVMYRDQLKEIKSKLAKNKTAAPLYDTARITRDIERAYVEMMAIWRSGERPRQISLSP